MRDNLADLIKVVVGAGILLLAFAFPCLALLIVIEKVLLPYACLGVNR